MTQKTIALIMTCDTKGIEAAYLRSKIKSMGANALLLDAGILGEAVNVVPDISRYEIARYGGYELSEIRKQNSRGDSLKMMSSCLKLLLINMFKEGKLHGVCSVGGSGGIALSSEAMQALPYGVPKLIATPMASGSRKFAPFVGYSDMIIMHTVIDICGLNWLSKMMFDNIAGTMFGMCNISDAVDSSIEGKRKEKCIGITMYGQTTNGVMAAKKVLENEGYTCMIFHGNGIGGPCMERLIKDGEFIGVLDYTTSEMVGTWIMGFSKCNPERLSVAGSYGLPHVVAPGAIDFINIYPDEINHPNIKGRSVYNHSLQFPLARTNKTEMEFLAEKFVEILNSSKGQTSFILPLKGFSAENHENGKLWGPDADEAFRIIIRKKLDPKVKLIEFEGNINDENCGVTAAKELINMLKRRKIYASQPKHEIS